MPKSMQWIDSAERCRTPGLNRQDDFAATGSVFEGVTPSLSGPADFAGRMAPALGFSERVHIIEKQRLGAGAHIFALKLHYPNRPSP
jgi:hypothetical protein